MAPSPARRTRSSADRWRYPLASVVASAALAVSLLAVPAYADTELPTEQATTEEPATQEPASGETATQEPASEETPTQDPATQETAEGQQLDEPKAEGRPEPAEAPDVEQLPPLQCNTVYAIQGSGTRNLWSVNTGTGTVTSVGTFSPVSGSGNLNGLGVTADGSRAFGVIQNASGSGRTVYVHDRASETTTLLGAGVNDAAITHGAVNPATGIYYYGGVTGTTINIYGFDPATSSSLGRVATGTITGAAGGNGDWAFDSRGSLYFVAGADSDNPIFVLNQTLPTTAVGTSVTVSATELATSDAPAAINGIAFGGDGYLYIASSNRIYQINPSSGADIADFALSATGSVDLASCAVPSTVEVVKDFPDGRAVGTDQATLAISGGGLTAPVTATTVGTDTGLQDDPAETAGPALGLNGNTYTISETGAGTGAAYVTSWACRNTTTGASLASGTGTTGTVTIPAGTATAVVVCTFTNAKPRDYGDAPASYGTTLADSGAAHTIGGPRLGAAIDGEADGVPGAAANGDDTAATDDEDGVAFNTDVTAAGRLETVFVTASAAGVLNGWIDYNRDGDFDTSERLFTDTAVASGVNRLTYTVPTGAAFVPGASYARFRISSAAGQVTSPTGVAPNGEVEDHRRELFDPAAAALQQCPVGSQPQAVSIIQNPSFENRTGSFANNTSANTINFAQNWYDAHTSGGQYHVFAPSFDSGPAEATMPFRAGADGYGFLGGHTASITGNNDVGEGATNTLVTALAPGTEYVGFFSVGAGGYSRNGSGYLRLFGVNDKNIGSIPQGGVVAPTATNQEALAATPVVGPAPAGTRAQWRTATFEFTPTAAWPYLRVEARNATPANNGSVGGQAWMSFDDFQLFACNPVPTDFGDAAASYGTTVAQDGPRHLITGYDAAADTSTLMLGGKVDDENDGAPGAAANGDDVAGTDDEDVASVAVAPGATTASATVPLVNNTGSPATLYGWLDTNGNGAFQASEATTVTVPDGATSATLSWTGLPPAADGAQPVVRLRLTSATLADASGTANVDERALGAAPDGEVEDLLAVVATLLPSSCTDPFVEDFGAGAGRVALPAGQTTYTYQPLGFVVDGQYTVINQVTAIEGHWWHNTADHTPGDTDGRLMLINAALAPGKFFTKTFTGLDVGTQYDFSAWIANANKNGNPILPNVTFRVVDPATGTTIASVDTGNIPLAVSLIWRQFGLKFTATQPTVRLELVNNAPGGSGNDLVIDDVAVGAVCERGDAPDSYGTLNASDGPVHGRGTARLGATVDYEGDGQPTAAADGDDANGTDDEDGVTFNPALGYPNPTIRTGPDPITLDPVVNHVNVNASAPGFASVWVDWNGDGDFLDAGEQVADAQPVTAGDNVVTFSQGTNPQDIRTHVRVRYSTDAASIHTPTGAAPDGEVEDYQVLVERLVTPAACSPVTDPYYAMTFSTATEQSGAGAPGTSARYPAVSVVRGEVVDAIAKTANPGATINANGFFVANGDDAAWNLNSGGSATEVTFTFVKTGTTTPVPVNTIWTVSDLDAGERTDFVPDTQVADYALTPGSQVSVSRSGGRLIFTGTVGGNNDIRSRYQTWFQDKSSIVAIWRGFGGSGFFIDGDGDVQVPKACDDFGDAPDSYKTLLDSDGPHHTVTAGFRLGADSEFDANGQPNAAADGDDTNRNDDEDGVAAAITVTAGQTTTVSVSATNNTAADGTLAGWIDLDNDGTFEPGERQTVAVPASSGTTAYSLTFPKPTAAGNSYARFRLLPGSPADPLPTGAATGGEVEDHRTTFVQGQPLFNGCISRMTFDSDNLAWRVATQSGGSTVVMPPRPVGWSATAGNPGGGLIENDLDGNVTELWTPAFVTNGYTTDHSALIGKTVQFDYKNNTGIGMNVYMGLVGTNGQTYWFIFRDQIKNSRDWNRIRVPMNAASWVTQWSGAPGPVPGSTAPTAAQFQAAMSSVDRFVFAIEGQTGPDTTQFDNFGQACDDFGDAPTSYGTAAGGEQPSHRPDSAGPALHMGATVDIEDASAPGAGANGDDTAGTDDEDGVGPIVVTSGSAPSITVTATNAGLVPATLAGWVDLDKSGTFDANERATATVPPLFPGGPVTLTFTSPVTTTQATYARFRLYPGTVASPLPKGPVDGGEVEDHPVTTLTPSLRVTKTSDATVSSGPGDRVTYTVTLTNTGTGDFTAGNPARVVDDLAGVLDDATYQADAAATVDGVAVADPTYAEPRISWSGPLAAGKSVVLTYSVELKGGGDGHVRNTAFVPPLGNPNPPTPDCAQTPQPCAPHEYELPKLTITKTSNRTQLPAVGQQLTYTVTVTNTGLGDYTAAHPATFEDDLTAVLDDATLAQTDVSATRGTATFTAPRLTWTGTLPAGQSATVIYTLTYTGAGDQQLDNSACIPVEEAADPADPCRTVSVPGSGLRHRKTVDPVSGTPVQVGQVLTYTLVFENVGNAAATVDTSDDLSDVLDDAQLVGTPTAGAGLTAAVAGNQLEIDGSVPAGETRTVTYQVQVRAYADQGDHVLENVLACEPSEPAGCAPETTSNPVRHLTLTKTSDATADSEPGDQVTYTVTAHNDGEGDWTAVDPATLVDDLTGVLDDATYDGTATATAGSTSYAAPRLTWTGPLAHGDTVTIEYTVTLTGGGDGHVDNVVWQPEVPGNPGPTPDCATATVPCAPHGYELPKLTIDKVSNRTRINADGDQITYTVTVTNPGPGDYTAGHPATFSDDLSDVLDDATFNTGSITATAGTATLNGSSLDWTGELAAGASATVTYTVTYDSTLGGDFVVDNAACVPEDEALDAAARCSTVKTPGSGLREKKRVDPASGTPVSEGQVLTYTLTFQNVGAAPAAVDNSDDLTGVVDDATVVPGSVVADPGLTATLNGSGDRIAITGTVPVGETLTVTYQVTVKPYADQGDHVITNALGCEPLDVPCVPTTTSNPVRHLTITKTSDATAHGKPGDTVSYTVRLVNDGEGDYTAASPAVLVDDLTGVLDDATFDGTAHASQGPAPAYAAPRITWSGPLVAGDEVRVTYEVVLKGGGDGHVDNVTWVPVDPGNPGPTPDCDTATVPCDDESYDLPKLTVAKSADRVDLPATGEQVTYTVRVTNVGPGVYTATHPATLADDLSDVLDDATLDSVSATTGIASVTGATLSWSGVLGTVGAFADITYTVTYRATGDHVLDNTACIPASEALTTADACDTVSVPGSGLRHGKSVSPAAGTPVEVGQVLTYTLTFDNTLGQAAATVDTEDDLSDVLDDAAFDDASITAGPGLAATRTGDRLAVTGSVPAGATRTVTYRVTVRPYADQGDHLITNALQCEAGEPDPCAPETVSNPVRHVVLTKVKTAPAEPDTGDQVTYTLTVHNDGAGDWTAADPAVVVDDLTGVLDDATWDGTQQATAGALSYAAPELTWTGALAAGATVTITYTVTVTNVGDHRLVNTASVTGCTLSECNPPDVVVPLPHVVPSKASAPTSGTAVQPGDVVTYTLRWVNDGLAASVVDSTDDLSGVLDDAVVVEEPTSSSASVTATRTGSTLRVVGPIAAGDTVTVTYKVRVKPAGQHGDNRMGNVLTQDTPQVDCTTTPCTPVPPPTTQHPVGDLDDWKTVDPVSGTSVKQGARLTYTLHFANTGTAPVAVNRVDDLSGVLDDAVLVAGPTASGGLTAAAPAAGRIAVTGTLAAGASATVTYTVQVKKDGQRGDSRLGNYLLDPGQQPPASCSTSMRADTRADCTANPVATTRFNLKLDKKVVSSTDVMPGDKVRYRLRVTNRGPDAAPGPIVLKDPLPAGLELVSAQGRGWTCQARQASDKVVCTYGKELPARKQAPAVYVVAKVGAGASGRLVNVAKVKAQGDTVRSDNKGVASVDVGAVPALPGTGFRVDLPRW